ncbi:MAG: hypothetical protein U0441_37045 [Polyangiaceae bacterium]
MDNQHDTIEYEILDLEGDLEPSSLRVKAPKLTEELAMLSGGLFDALPRADVPLDTFFPQTEEPSYWSRPRSDSIAPVAADAAPEAAPAKPMGPGWYVGMAAAMMVGLGIGALVQHKSAPQAAAQPVATVQAPAAQIQAPAQVAEAAPVKTNAPVKSGSAPIAKSVKKVDAPKTSEPVIETAKAEVPEKAAVPQTPAPSNAGSAIGAAGRGAAGCLPADELRRTMSVSVTFAPSGHATRATIDGGPHRGTAIGSCIAQQLRNATIAPFEGEAVTIHKTIHL